MGSTAETRDDKGRPQEKCHETAAARQVQTGRLISWRLSAVAGTDTGSKVEQAERQTGNIKTIFSLDKMQVQENSPKTSQREGNP